MLTGQAIKENAYLIRENPITQTPLEFTQEMSECCVNMPVLAETVFTNSLFNDTSSPLFFWGAGFSTATLVLQKRESGVWVDKETLDVADWGTPYAFGFFVNQYNQSAIGYELNWADVLNDVDLGEGNYRFKSVGTLRIGSGTVSKYSFEYCLSKYTADRADETVRIDWWQSGSFGDRDDDQLRQDYGDLNWHNSIRLPGAIFGFDTSPEFEETRTKYQNGESIWLRSSQVESYTLKAGRYDQTLHKYIKVEILQADKISITDYTIANPTRHQNKFVILSGGYEPKWTIGSMTANVEVKFLQHYQNFNHKRQ